MELNAEAYCIAEHFDGLIAMVTPQIKSRNHTLNVAVRNLEHENVIGDLVRIKQVFLNIISNPGRGNNKYFLTGAGIRQSGVRGLRIRL